MYNKLYIQLQIELLNYLTLVDMVENEWVSF